MSSGFFPHQSEKRRRCDACISKIKGKRAKKKKNKISKQLSQRQNVQSVCVISILLAFEIFACKTKVLLDLHLRIKLHCLSCF